MTPFAIPVAITLMETPSGAVEKHTAVICSLVVTDPTSATLIVCSLTVEPPLSVSLPTVTRSPDTSLTQLRLTYNNYVYV